MTANRAALASDALTTALLQLAARGQRTHCSDPELHNYWLSENPTHRAVAATLCTGCPVLDPCRDTAELHGERFGVFGGKDFTRRPGKGLE
jgi:hypothetical protein